MSTVFRVAGLSYTYPSAERPALDRIDLMVGNGSVFGLLGPNGCGKTTLLRVLAGTLRPERGDVRLFPDAPSRSADGDRRREAVCFDRTPFVEALSGRENAIRLTSMRGAERDDATARVEHWLSVFGMSERADEPVATYSLGMRRKLGLTEAFAARPELMLLDEPLGGLDADGRAALFDSLRAERELGATVVVAIHDPEFAAAVCDAVVFMDAGRILTEGEPQLLIDSLDLETTFDVEVAGPPAADPGTIALPDGVRSLGATEEGVRLASVGGAGALPDTVVALVAAGIEIRAMRVREPNLDDVFASLTGRGLRVEAT